MEQFFGWFGGSWWNWWNPGNNVHKGTKGDDVLTGTDANESFHARRGDDLIAPGAGHDFVDGGRGTDTAQFEGSLSDYDINVGNAGWGFFGWWGHGKVFVTDTRNGDVDALKRVEVLEFDDAFYYLDGRPDPIEYKDPDPQVELVVPDSAQAIEDEAWLVAGLTGDPAQITGADATALFALTVTADNGTLAVADASVTPGASLVLNGTAAEINAQLATLTHTPDANTNGAEAIRFELSDADGNAVADDELPVVIAAVNDDPEGQPVIAGVAQLGVELTADPSAVTDVDGLGDLSYQWEALVAGDWVAIPDATAMTFTPGEDQVGLQVRARVSYTDDDGTDESVVSDATEAVTGAGDVPAISAPASAATDEDVVLPFSETNGNPVTITGVDPDLQLSLIVTAPNGVLATGVAGATEAQQVSYSGTAAEINAQLASLAYTPNANYHGDETLTFELFDSDGVDLASKDIPVVINPINDAAEGAAAILGDVKEGATLIAETSDITDVEGVGIPQFQWQVSGPAGTWADIDGAMASTFVPTTDHVGQMLRVVTSFTDGEGNPESVTSAPTAAVVAAGGTTGPMLLETDEDTAVEFKLSDLAGSAPGATAGPVVTHIEGVELATLALGAIITLASGALVRRLDDDTFAYEPTVFDALGDNQGTYDGFAYTIDDGSGGTTPGQLAIKVGGVNDTPDGQPTVIGTPVAGTALIANVAGVSDAEGIASVPALQWQSLVDGDWVDIDGATAPTYTPVATDAGLMLRVVMSYADGNGVAESVASEATAPVGGGGGNTAPVANDDNVSILSATESVIINLIANDFDADGDALTITFDPAQLPAGVEAHLLDTDADGFADSIELVPEGGATFPAAFDFNYQISDGNGGSDTATVTVTLDTGGNQAPVVADAIQDQTTAEEAAFSFEVPVGTFVDPDGDALTYTATLADGDPLPDWLGFDPDRPAFLGTPDDPDVGPIDVTVRATDPGGLFVEETFAINVTPVNDAPVAQDDTGSGVGEIRVSVLDNDSDVEDGAIDPATIQLVDGDDGFDGLQKTTPEGIWVVDTATGEIVFTADPAFAGPTSEVQYFVTDSEGLDSDPATVTVSLDSGGNQAPVAADDSASGPVGTPITVDVLDGDFDPEGAIDPESVQIVDADDPEGRVKTVGGEGRWIVEPGGTITFIPDPGFTGPVTPITYTVADNEGLRSNEANVTVSIDGGGGNTDPVANDDVASTSEGQDVLINVLSNDTDADLDQLFVTGVAGAPNGELILVDDDSDGFVESILYIPDSGFTGPGVFTYTISDGNGGTDTATVTVNVGDTINQPPEVVDAIQDQSTAEEATFTFEVPTGTFADPDGDDLTLSATLADGSPLPDWLHFDPAPPSFVGTPDDPDVGTINVTVRATDPGGLFVEETFALNVTPINDAPSGLPAIAGTPQVGTELVADTDAISDDDGLGTFAFQWQEFDKSRNIWMSIDGAEEATFTPATEHAGVRLRVVVSYVDLQGTSESITSTATDPIGGAVTNQQPKLAGDLAATVAEGASVVLTMDMLDFTDPDDAPADVSFFVDKFGGGEILLNGNPVTSFTGEELREGRVAFQHDGSETSSAEFVVTVEDGDEDQSTPLPSIFRFTVTPVNDDPTVEMPILPESATVGTELTADVSGIADADGLPDPSTFAYRWESFNGTTWTAIDGATDASFTPGAEHEGQPIRVVISYTDAGGTDESVVSEAVEPAAAPLAELLIFEARDASHGNELWVSDGTESGTVLLKDIQDGSIGSGPNGFTLLNNKVIFQANNGTNGSELWVTDGTTAGTVLLKDINPNGNASPNDFALVGDKLIFEATDGSNGNELWVTDGTTAGTMLLKDINPNGNASPNDFTLLGGKLIFEATDGINGRELWVTDGTTAGTMLLKDINPNGDASPNDFTLLGDKLIFEATDGSNGNELWVTDGTTAGTMLLKDINPNGASNPSQFTRLGNSVVFLASDGTNGIELWVTDGTSDGTVLLKDINPNGNGSPNEFTLLGDKLVFEANDGTGGSELWVTDGTADGTVLLKEINPDGNGSPNEFTLLGDKLIFQANDGTSGNELWVTDGSVDGTMLLKDINSGDGFSSPSGFVIAGGKLFLRADDGATGDELWVTDGTPEGTRLVKDLNTATDYSDPYDFTALGDQVVFQANDGVNGYELWASDGTAEGTVLIKDIHPTGGSSPNDFALVNGKLVFEANDGDTGRELWVTDGTTDGTILLKDIREGSGPSNPYGYTLINDKLVFQADDGINGRELWVTDGTTDGTMLLKDIHPTGGSSPYDFTLINDKLVFQADDGINGRELWVTDGTTDGTVLLKDIHPTGSSSPSQFTELNGKLFFRADDGTNGSELWVTDGTVDGTVQLADLNPTGSSGPNDFIRLGETLIFRANDGTNGSELWVTDGTAEGTTLLKDIRDGSGSSNPNDFALVNGKVVFEADDGVNGRELWVTDGTPEGTLLLKDINPNGNSNLYDLVTLDDKVFFAANDGTHGYELWVTDGTPEGTLLLKDINPGSEHGDPYGMTVVGDKVYFSANDGVTEYEFWVSDGTAEGTHLVTDINTIGEGSFPNDLIALNPLNDAPEGTDGAIATDEETPYAFSVDDFGFTDPKDRPADAFASVMINVLPLVGLLTLAGTPVAAGDVINVGDIDAGNLVYTPDDGSNGTYTLDFQVKDDGGTVDGGVDLDPTPNTITIDVAIPNQAPIASPVNLGATNEDLAKVITAAELFAGVDDPDGPTLELSDLSISAGGGVLQDLGSGNWLYTPEQDDDSEVTFSYTVSDGDLSATSTASLDLLSVNDAPLTSPIGDQTWEVGETSQLDVSDFFDDPDGDVLTYAVSFDDPAAVDNVSFDTSTGVLTAAPEVVLNEGLVAVVVTATDPGGLTADINFNVFVADPGLLI